MPKYDNEIKALNDMRADVLRSDNPYRLTPKQQNDFRLVINTLLYIADDTNMATLKTQKWTFCPGSDGESKTYVPLHLEEIRPRVERELDVKSEAEICDGVEKYLIGTLITPFIQAYTNIKTAKTAAPTAEAEKNIIQERIKQFCELMGGNCIDKRTVMAIDYGLKIGSDPTFTAQMSDAHKNITITDYYHGLIEIIDKKWGEPFREEKADVFCQTKGTVGIAHYKSIHRFLEMSCNLTPDLSTAIAAYKKCNPLKRHIFINFMRAEQPEILIHLSQAFLATDPQAALEIAVQANQPSMMQSCLDAGARVSHLNARGKTPIHQAAELGAWECVQAILAQRPLDVDNTGQYGMALAFALRSNHLRSNQPVIAKKLIQSQTSVNVFLDKFSPLHIALSSKLETKSEEKSEEKTIEELLVEAKADINAMQEDGHSPLMMTTNPSVSIGTMNWLLEQKGIHIDQQDATGKTALMHAAISGSREKVLALLAKGANAKFTNYYGRTARHFVAVTGHFDIFLLLAEREGLNLSDPNVINQLAEEVYAGGNTLFHLIARFNKPEYLERFVVNETSMIKTNTENETPIQIAGKLSHWGCVEQFANLWPDCAVAGRYGSVLRYAASQSQWAVVDLLLQKKEIELTWCDFNNGAYAIHHAILQNNIPAATRLLEAKANINVSMKASPLAMAAESKEVTHETFEWLLAQDNIDLTLKTSDGKTPLFLATRAGNIHKVRALKRESENKEEVEVAVEQGDFAMLDVLVPDFDRCHYLRKKIFSHGNSLLHLAIKHKQPPAVIERLVVRAGYNHQINRQNENKLTPIELAANNRDWETVRFIASRQPDIANAGHYGEVLLTTIKTKEWETSHQLIDAKATPHLFDEKGCTVLHYAILANEEKTIAKLLEAGANIDARAPNTPNPTPLIIATSKQVSLATFANLCEQKVNVNLANAAGETPLMLLTSKIEDEKEAGMALEKAKILLKSPMLVVDAKNAAGKTALMMAAEQDNVELLTLLISIDKSWPTYRFENNETLFHIVAKLPHEKSLDILNIMLSQEHKMDLNARNSKGETALFLAAQGSIDKVTCLLSVPSIDMQAKRLPGDGKTACAHARDMATDVAILFVNKQIKHLLTCEFHLDAILQTLQDGEATLSAAVQEKDWEDARTLLANIQELVAFATRQAMERSIPFHPSTSITADDTLLHFAAHTNDVKKLTTVFSALKDEKVLNNKNRAGETALFIAAKKGHLESVKFFLSQPGIDIESKQLPGAGRTARAIALESAHEEIVGLLAMAQVRSAVEAKEDTQAVLFSAIWDVLNVGATPKWPTVNTLLDNLREFASGYSFTPCNKTYIDIVLLRSARDSQWDIVEKLLMFDAGLSEESVDGKNAFDYVVKSGRTDLIQKLLPKASLSIIAEVNYAGSLVSSDEKDVRRNCYTEDDTLLHLAAGCTTPDWTMRLLAAGYPKTAVNKNGFTPAHIACQKKHWNIVKTLMMTPQESKEEMRYESIMLEAAKAQQWDIVDLILSTRPRINYCDPESNDTLLHIAITQNAPMSLFQKVLQQPETVADCKNRKGDTPLMLAIRANDTDKIAMLLKKQQRASSLPKSVLTTTTVASSSALPVTPEQQENKVLVKGLGTINILVICKLKEMKSKGYFSRSKLEDKFLVNLDILKKKLHPISEKHTRELRLIAAPSTFVSVSASVKDFLKTSVDPIASSFYEQLSIELNGLLVQTPLFCGRLMVDLKSHAKRA